MLEHITLTHCTPVKIYPPPGPPPQNVTVHLNVGNLSGEGAVNVHSGSDSGPIVGSVDTGDSDDVLVLAAMEVWIHYVKIGDAPDTVDVDYEIDLN